MHGVFGRNALETFDKNRDLLIFIASTGRYIMQLVYNSVEIGSRRVLSDDIDDRQDCLSLVLFFIFSEVDDTLSHIHVLASALQIFK